MQPEKTGMIFWIKKENTVPFLFFPDVETIKLLALGKCGSTLKVIMPFFTKDSASASWTSEVTENFLFPSSM